MKLCDLYPTLSTQEREALAQSVNTAEGYLWQLATRWRGRKPSLDMLKRLADADKRLKVADLVAEFSEDEHKAA